MRSLRHAPISVFDRRATLTDRVLLSVFSWTHSSGAELRRCSLFYSTIVNIYYITSSIHHPEVLKQVTHNLISWRVCWGESVLADEKVKTVVWGWDYGHSFFHIMKNFIYLNLCKCFCLTSTRVCEIWGAKLYILGLIIIKKKKQPFPTTTTFST